jgi:hypothetical protein
MFSSSDESYNVIVMVINAGGSLNDLSTILSQHPLAGGRLLEFNSNNYSLSSHPAIRTITIFGSSPAIKYLTYGTISADET